MLKITKYLTNLLLGCWERWMRGEKKLCFFSNFLKSNITLKKVYFMK